MYPRPFEYARVETVEEAIDALAGADGEVRPIAGGQSLVPMMGLGLAAPDLLVDIGRLPLAGFERTNGTVGLGALTRHRELERSAELGAQLPLAAEAARQIGNLRVRNRGTFGGSLSHADPAAELGAVALTYGGEVVIAGSEGRAPGRDRRLLRRLLRHRGRDRVSCSPGSSSSCRRPGSGPRLRRDRQPRRRLRHRGGDGAGDDRRRRRLRGGEAGAGRGRRPAAALRARGGRLSRRGAQARAFLDQVAETVAETVEPETDAFTSAGYRARAAGICASRALGHAWRRARGDGR